VHGKKVISSKYQKERRGGKGPLKVKKDSSKEKRRYSRDEGKIVLHQLEK